MKEESLVFIVSQPRSGSTYLQNILSNNSEVNTASEHWTLLNLTSLIKPELLSAQYDLPLATDAFRDYVAKYPEMGYTERLKAFILGLYEHQKKGYRFVIDKTPRYWELLDELVELFPGSKIIILKRDPLKVIRSIIRTWHIDSLEKLTNYRRDLFLAVFKLNVFEKRQQHNPNIKVVHYEELIRDTADEIRKITDWLGITFNDTMLSTSHNKKIQGKYGDPFQNPKQQSRYNKEKAAAFSISEEIKSFINEYDEFISGSRNEDNPDNWKEKIDAFSGIKEFFKLNGSTSASKDRIDLLNEIQIENRLLRKELNSIKSSRSFNIGKKILAPFKFLRSLFNLS